MNDTMLERALAVTRREYGFGLEQQLKRTSPLLDAIRRLPTPADLERQAERKAEWKATKKTRRNVRRLLAKMPDRARGRFLEDLHPSDW